MKRIPGIVVLLALLAACSSDESPEAKPVVPPPATFASGWRLRAMYTEIDGVKYFVGWHDTKLGVPCAFAAERCLTGTTTRYAQSASAMYEDASCTSRLVSFYPSPPEWVIFVDDARGCGTSTLHTASERVIPTEIYFRSPEGECKPAGEGAVSGEYARIGPALSPAAEPFVHAREENGPGPGRIVPRWRVTDDGARQIIGAWDTERNEPVSTTGRTSGKRWLPSDVATPVGESTCPGIATSFACSPTAAFIGGDGCRDPEIYMLGPAADRSACPEAAGDGYTIASKVPVAAFAEATKIVVGGGRVRLEMSATADGDPVEPRSFIDTEGGTIACRWRWMECFAVNPRGTDARRTPSATKPARSARCSGDRAPRRATRHRTFRVTCRRSTTSSSRSASASSEHGRAAPPAACRSRSPTAPPPMS